MFGRTMRLALSMAAMAMAVTTLPVLAATPAAAEEGCGGKCITVGRIEIQDDHRRNDVGFWVGPAIVTNAGNRCIVANGWIFWQGERRKVHTDGPTLCG